MPCDAECCGRSGKRVERGSGAWPWCQSSGSQHPSLVQRGSRQSVVRVSTSQRQRLLGCSCDFTTPSNAAPHTRHVIVVCRKRRDLRVGNGHPGRARGVGVSRKVASKLRLRCLLLFIAGRPSDDGTPGPPSGPRVGVPYPFRFRTDFPSRTSRQRPANRQTTRRCRGAS
jgi:hypothetical protein